jgi:hypothetical protein
MLGAAEDQTVTIDVRSCRGPDCHSDHYLVKSKVRERIANAQKIPRRKTRRWEVEKLHKDTAQSNRYQKALDVKLKQSMEGEEEIDSVQKRWEHLEQVIKATAEETIGKIKYKKKEEWFDEECVTYIREKNKARQKMLQKETRSNCEEYQEWRWKTNRICKRKRERI